MKKLTISSFALSAFAAAAMILNTSSAFAQVAIGTFKFSLSTNAPAGPYWQGGHGDIDIHEHTPGDWEIHYHFHAATNAVGPTGGNGFPGTPEVHAGKNEWEWEPDTLTTWINTGVPSLALTRPVGSQWDFTGAIAGQTVYVLPTRQAAGLPRLGFSAEDHTFNVIYTLGAVTGVTGGTISAWTDDGIGNPTALWSSSSPGDTMNNNSLTVLAGGHNHVYIGFSQAGDYTAEISALPEPSSGALLLVGMAAVAGLRRRIRRPV